MNIVLIGYRGAGKSTVGRCLAIELGKTFVDCDERIETEMQASIREIVEDWGWHRFRQMEKKVIQEVAGQNDLVIAPGGGSILDRENVRALKANGLLIWLKADLAVLRQRVLADPGTQANRPALTGKGREEEFAEVYHSREPFYAQAADLIVETSALSVIGVVREIRSLLEERGGG